VTFKTSKMGALRLCRELHITGQHVKHTAVESRKLSCGASVIYIDRLNFCQNLV